MSPSPMVPAAAVRAPKHATGVSGSKLEARERPLGGLSAALADGQGWGGGCTAQDTADAILERPVQCHQGRPSDDVRAVRSVLLAADDAGGRRLGASFPIT